LAPFRAPWALGPPPPGACFGRFWRPFGPFLACLGPPLAVRPFGPPSSQSGALGALRALSGPFGPFRALLALFSGPPGPQTRSGPPLGPSGHEGARRAQRGPKGPPLARRPPALGAPKRPFWGPAGPNLKAFNGGLGPPSGAPVGPGGAPDQVWAAGRVPGAQNASFSYIRLALGPPPGPKSGLIPSCLKTQGPSRAAG